MKILVILILLGLVYQYRWGISGSSYTKSGKGYQWNSSQNNKWEESSLKVILNGEYYSSLGDYQKYINTTKWYLGAPTYLKHSIYTPELFYQEERSNTQGYSKGATSYINNIGLMYPSDYGYSLTDKKDEVLYNNASVYKENAWLYQLENPYFEWTISPETNFDDGGYLRSWQVDSMSNSGGAITFRLGLQEISGVRPTFYLSANVLYSKGDGSISNPYRLGL